MPLSVKDVDQLRKYLSGVMDRADHHANNVNEIALALVGAILWRKDDDAHIKVMAQNGETKNVLWVRIGQKRYAFSYNHRTGKIEMRTGSIQGKPIQSFSNKTALSKVRKVFEVL